LMLGAKVSSAARAAGTNFQSVANAAKLIDALQEHFLNASDGDAIARVLIDLQIPGLEVSELKRQLDELSLPVEVFAYAQHVMTDLIDAATAAEIGIVMTRGQFDRKVNDLIR
jgi:CheY-like chemotaxis protein